jgi:tetratricopeptide (TPR) repeat protein
MMEHFDLGNYSRPVTTSSRSAQNWFDRGLVWTYAFAHEEAARCFRRATAADPGCAIAWWGIAYSLGPYINKEWRFYAEDELQETLPAMSQALHNARDNATHATPVEQALIQALMQRYKSQQPQPVAVMDGWNHDYADAMAPVYAEYSDDLDVIALYAEAMMMRTPWKLWDARKRQPAEGADTLEMMAVLNHGLALVAKQQWDPHPGIVHMYIHTMEMSPWPERALPAANGLRDLVPDAGHLRHMPTHIDVLCGDYHAAVVASRKAIAADKKYLAKIGPFDYYTAACCHDYHQLMFAAMFLGQFQTAIDAADGMHGLLTEEVLRTEIPSLAITLESYYSMRLHVLVRFGRWQQIVDEPLPPDPQLYCVTTAMSHYARGIAFATLKQFAAAETERQQFEAVLATIPEERHLFNNTSHTVLAIAREMLVGELAYHQENCDVAFAHLRNAVALNDNLHYTEPWAWMHPPRHALGALLLAQGHVQEHLLEAEQVYREDLGLDERLSRWSQHPDNVWSLHGYVECLRRLGKHEEAAAMQPRLDLAMSYTDDEIKASCACRLAHECCT